jgi:hypothetical protein
MTEPSPTSKLDPKKLGRLLELYCESAEEGDGSNPDQQRTLLLRDYLEDTLPLTAKVLQVLPSLLQQVYGDTSRLEGQSLYKLLLEPSTAIHDLITAKELAKRKVSKAQTQAEKEVAGTVYYAAIAAGVAFHGEKITQHSYQQLETSLESLLTINWIFTDIKDLLKAAKITCREQLANE